MNDLWCKIKFWKSYEVDCGDFCFEYIMVVHGKDGKDVLKLCLGLWWEVFWKERFVWNVDFVEGGVVNFKEQGFKDF